MRGRLSCPAVSGTRIAGFVEAVVATAADLILAERSGACFANAPSVA